MRILPCPKPLPAFPLCLRFIFPALAILLLAAVTVVQAAPRPTAPDYGAVDAYVAARMKALQIPGLAYGVVRGGQVEHLQGFGAADSSGQAVTPQTPFRIGPLGPAFTAQAILQLSETGAIALDAPIQTYLPWFTTGGDPAAVGRITVRHCLYHVSAIPASAALAARLSEPASREQQVSALSSVRLSGEPGQVFEYNPMNEIILELIVQVVTGTGYENYLQDHVFIPLKMTTSFTDPAAAQRQGLAASYHSWFGFPTPMEPRPGSALISGAEDLTHFLIAQLQDGRYQEKDLLSPAGMLTLHRPVVSVQTGGSLETYAMGWFDARMNAIPVQRQAGAQPSASAGLFPSPIAPDSGEYAALVLLPETNRGLVVLANTGGGLTNPALDDLTSGIVSLLNGQRPPAAPLLRAWGPRALLLLPGLQITGFLLLSAAIGRWRAYPETRPSRPIGRIAWVGLPLLPDLAAVAGLLTFFTGQAPPPVAFTAQMQSAPDLAVTFLGCGVFALLWGAARTRMALSTFREKIS